MSAATDYFFAELRKHLRCAVCGGKVVDAVERRADVDGPRVRPEGAASPIAYSPTVNHCHSWRCGRIVRPPFREQVGSSSRSRSRPA